MHHDIQKRRRGQSPTSAAFNERSWRPLSSSIFKFGYNSTNIYFYYKSSKIPYLFDLLRFQISLSLSHSPISLIFASSICHHNCQTRRDDVLVRSLAGSGGLFWISSSRRGTSHAGFVAHVSHFDFRWPRYDKRSCCGPFVAGHLDQSGYFGRKVLNTIILRFVVQK